MFDALPQCHRTVPAFTVHWSTLVRRPGTSKPSLAGFQVLAAALLLLRGALVKPLKARGRCEVVWGSMAWAGLALSLLLACCILSACLAFSPLSLSPYSNCRLDARSKCDAQRRNVAGGIGLQMVGDSRRGKRGQAEGSSAKRSLTPRNLNRRGRGGIGGGGGGGRRRDSKDEDEDWDDPQSPEIRVMKARQSGQYSIPSWAKTLEIKGHGRMMGKKSKKVEDSPYVVLREFRGGQLPEDVSATHSKTPPRDPNWTHRRLAQTSSACMPRP